MPTPDFVVGGAPKCGTTSLCSYLNYHPEIFITDPKEPHYYLSSATGRPACGCNFTRSEYRDLFSSSLPGQFVGEGSTWYLSNAGFVAPAIYKDNPSARLIFVLRDPVRRAYSDYWFHLNRGDLPSGLPFSHYARNPDHWLFNGSKYVENLKVFFDCFGKESVLVVLSEDLRRSRADVLAKVCRHIGVDPLFDFPETREQNTTRYPRWPRLMSMVGRVIPGLSSRFAKIPILRGVRNRALFSLRSCMPPMDIVDKEFLCCHFADDVDRLEVLISRDLTSWKHG